MGLSKTAVKSSPEVGLIFDSTTRAVMAQGKQDGIREKVTAVREVVRGRSNDEITQVLLHYDDDVERTIQAFLDGDATEVLMEWQHAGHKQPAKRKKNKRAAVQNPPPHKAAEFNPPLLNPPEPLRVNGNSNATHLNGDLHSPKSLTESFSSTTSSFSTISSTDPRPSTMNGSSKRPPPQQIPRNQRHQHTRPPRTAEAARSRTMSEASTASDSGKRGTGTYAGLEKSMKDLQRQVFSLQRLRTVMADGFEVSFKSIATCFEEFRKNLNDREAEVIFEMDKVKHQTTELLGKRQRTAIELKNRAMKAQLMNEKDLSALRAEIKHFVSERKLDEDISSTNRFVWDAEQSKQFLKSMCSVVPVKTTYQHTTSDVEETEDPSPPSPSAIAPPKADNSGAKVVTQSDSLTQFEKSGTPIADIHKAAPPRSAKRSSQIKPEKKTAEMNNNQTTANKNQTTVNRNQTPVNRNQTPVNRNQTTANRNQTTANRNQTTANRNQTTANRNQTTATKIQTTANKTPATEIKNQATEEKKSRNAVRRDRDRQKKSSPPPKTPPSDTPTAAVTPSPVNEALPQRKERERRPRPDLTNGET